MTFPAVSTVSTPATFVVARAAKSTAMADTDAKGAFVRAVSGFRHMVAPDSPFPPESRRYHLYMSYACPWANRILTALYLKGLTDHVGVSVTHPSFARTRPEDPDDTHVGWMFRAPGDAPLVAATGRRVPCDDALVPDPYYHSHSVRDLYAQTTDGVVAKRFTVPVWWDTQTKRVVNNESSEILRFVNDAFNHLATNPDLDLYPVALRESIDEVNTWTYDCVNNGVYKCGFATSQEAYDEAIDVLYDGLDRAEVRTRVRGGRKGSWVVERELGIERITRTSSRRRTAWDLQTTLFRISFYHVLSVSLFSNLSVIIASIHELTYAGNSRSSAVVGRGRDSLHRGGFASVYDDSPIRYGVYPALQVYASGSA
jgi:glutathionyl-hydroquinone reductase